MMYKVINKSKQRTLGWKVKLAHSLEDGASLWSKQLPIGAGIFLHQCNRLWGNMLKVSYDALFLNEDNQIIHLIEDIHPTCTIEPIALAVHVIKLPPGTIYMTNTELGDIIQITTCNC